MKILFRNEHFVAVDKEPGFLSVPGRDPADDRPILGRELERELGVVIYPIHRLDAEVSGLVLYALTTDAHREANQQFENRRVQKIYQAYSSGGSWTAGDRGEWKCRLLRGKKRAYESPAGKLAITGYEIVNVADGLTEWRLYPKTGRSHQLRYELYRHETPICGDVLYGSTRPWSKGIALRSLLLRFDEEFAGRWGLPRLLEAAEASRPSANLSSV